MHAHETEVRFRMARLAAEAEHVRLVRAAARGAPRKGGARRLVGHLLIAVGSAVEGAGSTPCPDERPEGARA